MISLGEIYMTSPTLINKAAISTISNKKDKIAIVVSTVTTTYWFLHPHLNKLSRYSEFFILKSNILRSISLYQTVNGNRKYALRILSRFTILINKTIIVNLFIIIMSILTPSFILRFFLSGNPRYE